MTNGKITTICYYCKQFKATEKDDEGMLFGKCIKNQWETGCTSSCNDFQPIKKLYKL